MTRRLPRVREVPLRERLLDEVRRITRVLRDDLELIILYWNLYRSLDFLFDALASSWREHPPEALLDLDEEQLQAAADFFEPVERFRLWAHHTDAMPATLEARVQAFLDEIAPLAQAAERALEPHAPGT